MSDAYPIVERYGPFRPRFFASEIAPVPVEPDQVVVAKTISGKAGVVSDPQHRYRIRSVRALTRWESYNLFYVDVSWHRVTLSGSFEGFSIELSGMCRVNDPVRVVLDNLKYVENKLAQHVRATVIKLAREDILRTAADAARLEKELTCQFNNESASLPGVDVQIQKIAVALDPPREHHHESKPRRVVRQREVKLRPGRADYEDKDIEKLMRQISQEYLGYFPLSGHRLVSFWRARFNESGQNALSGTAFIWTSGDDGSEVADALKELFAEYGVALEDEGPPVRGSWKQRFKLIWQGFASLDAVQSYDWQGEVARRLQIELVERRAAEVDGIKADTVSKLLPALEKHDKVVIRLGQIVIVKYYDKLVVETIDPVTAAKLDRHKDLSTDPERMLQVLSGEVTLADEPALQAQLVKEIEGE